MRIITCLKYVPEISALTESFSINRDEDGKINPADMFAIEESIRIKERYGAEAIGLCMGVLGSATALKHAIAMGLDRVILMSDSRFAGSDTFATSYILSQGITHIGQYDLIICGKQSTDGDTGQVAQELAAHLGIPCLTHVVSVDFSANRRVCCVVLTEQGYLKVEMQLPAVISVLKGINEPRIPSIPGIFKAQKANIEIVNRDDLNINSSRCGLHGSPTRVKKIQRYTFEPKQAIDITDKYLNIIDAELQKARLSTVISPRSPACNKRPTRTLRPNGENEVWVLCEVHNGTISEVSLQVLSKAADIVGEHHCLCTVLLDPVHADVINMLSTYGVFRLYCAGETYGVSAFDESKLSALATICRKYRPGVVLVGGTVWGRWLAPFVAAKLGTGLTSDCLDLRIEAETNNLIQTRTAYGGSLIAEIICPEARPQMATVRTNVFPNTKSAPGAFAAPEIIDISEHISCCSRITVIGVERSRSFSDGLSVADIVLCGGRGIGGNSGFDLLRELARLTGGTVGATRYAVDAGWIDYSFQIGQTGTTVRPKIYMNFGVSGAFEHIVGMQNSKCVISVNQDPNAPIFAHSDYKIIGECHAVLTALINYLTDKKG